MVRFRHARHVFRHPRESLDALSQNMISVTGVAIGGITALAAAHPESYTLIGIPAMMAGATTSFSMIQATWYHTVTAYHKAMNEIRTYGSIDGLLQRHPEVGTYYCSQSGVAAAAKRAGIPDPFPGRTRSLAIDIGEELVPGVRTYRNRREKRRLAA